ncbi:MAG: hypothetical protein H6742_05250 [Alphaproteobacteria bacterium]|nr:hypothetical protein [Alphaproteobacteria bacterium]
MSRILLVSADEQASAATIEAFRSLGRLVLRVDDADAAVAHLAEEPADLVVVDTDATCASGRELVRRLREDSDPAVAWTGQGVASGLGLVFAEVPDAVLAPPVTMASAGAMLGRLEREGARHLDNLRDLSEVDGPIEHFPPLRVLWAAQLARARGMLELYVDERERELHLDGGRIVDARGFPDLLVDHGISIDDDDGLEAAIGKAVAAGVRPDLAMQSAGLHIGTEIAAMVGRAGGMVFFDPAAEAPPRPVPLPTPLPLLLASGMTQARAVAQVRQTLGPLRGNRLVAVTEGFGPGGLPPSALRLWRAAQSGPALGEVVGDADADWQAADLLLQLGLARLEVRAETQPLARSARGGGRVRATDDGPKLDTAEQERLQELIAERARLRELDAPGILGITASADATARGVEQRFRLLSARFHPDRYSRDSEQLARVAKDCFSLVNDAASILRQPHHREEIFKRLEARERGQVYVTDADRRRAKMHYVAGEAAFRRKQTDQALKELERAHDADPTDWKVCLLLSRTWFDTGHRPPEECYALASPLIVPEGRARSEQLQHLGELLLALGKEDQAHRAFRQAVVEWEDNHEAKRRLRLHRMRTEGVDAVRAQDRADRDRREQEREQERQRKDRRQGLLGDDDGPDSGGSGGGGGGLAGLIGGLFKRDKGG